MTTKLNDFNKKLIAKCNELGYSMGESKNYKARNKKVVGRCFNKIGIVVPVDVNDVGYRPLPMTNSMLLNYIHHTDSTTCTYLHLKGFITNLYLVLPCAIYNLCYFHNQCFY